MTELEVALDCRGGSIMSESDVIPQYTGICSSERGAQNSDNYCLPDCHQQAIRWCSSPARQQREGQQCDSPALQAPRLMSLRHTAVPPAKAACKGERMSSVQDESKSCQCASKKLHTRFFNTVVYITSDQRYSFRCCSACVLEKESLAA